MTDHKKTLGLSGTEGQNSFVFSPADYNTDPATGVDYGKPLTPVELQHLRSVINAYIDGVIDEEIDPFQISLVTPGATEFAEGCPDPGPGYRIFEVIYRQWPLTCVFLTGAIGDKQSTLIGVPAAELQEDFEAIHAMVKRLVASDRISGDDHRWLNYYSWDLKAAHHHPSTWQRIAAGDQMVGTWKVYQEPGASE